MIWLLIRQISFDLVVLIFAPFNTFRLCSASQDSTPFSFNALFSSAHPMLPFLRLAILVAASLRKTQVFSNASFGKC